MLTWLRKKRREREIGRLASQYLNQLTTEKIEAQRELDAYLPPCKWVLSHLEGVFEVKVGQIEVPGAEFIAIAGEESRSYSKLKKGTLFSLVSAFEYRGNLKSLGIKGWAIVRAYPLGAPGLIENAPGYHGHNYFLCILRNQEMWSGNQSLPVDVDELIKEAPKAPEPKLPFSNFQIKA